MRENFTVAGLGFSSSDNNNSIFRSVLQNTSRGLLFGAQNLVVSAERRSLLLLAASCAVCAGERHVLAQVRPHRVAPRVAHGLEVPEAAVQTRAVVREA